MEIPAATSAPPPPALEAHDLTISYNRKPVLWGVDFAIPQGALACIVGPNGAGKSTFIKCAMNLISPDSGYVQIFGKSLDTVRRRVSYVPQRESVDWDFPISVQEVVMMGRHANQRLFSRNSHHDEHLVAQALDKVGLTQLASRQISQLSGGQQQRVFIARALAQEADFYFMDEPFAGVDMSTEQAVVAILKQMSEAGKTIVAVHHDLQSVSRYFTHIVMLNARLVAAGPVSEVFTEQNLSETFGGKLSILTSIEGVASQNQVTIGKTI
jgi:manganese/zinc/iron transport system ATP- binding protein